VGQVLDAGHTLVTPLSHDVSSGLAALPG
jgi:hypothetical protein